MDFLHVYNLHESHEGNTVVFFQADTNQLDPGLEDYLLALWPYSRLDPLHPHQPHPVVCSAPPTPGSSFSLAKARGLPVNTLAILVF